MDRDAIDDPGIPQPPAPKGPPPLPPPAPKAPATPPLEANPVIQVDIPGGAPIKGELADIREYRSMLERELTGPAARDAARAAVLRNNIAAIDQALAGR